MMHCSRRGTSLRDDRREPLVGSGFTIDADGDRTKIVSMTPICVRHVPFCQALNESLEQHTLIESSSRSRATRHNLPQL